MMNDLEVLKDLKVYLETSNVYIAYANIKNNEEQNYMFLVRPVLSNCLHDSTSDVSDIIQYYQEIITGENIIGHWEGCYPEFDDVKIGNNDYFFWSVFIYNPVNTILSIEEIKTYLAKKPEEIEKTLRYLRNPQNDLIDNKSNTR